MKYRVDETYTYVCYGKEKGSIRNRITEIEGYPVYETSDGWDTGVEKFFDTLDEAIAYCEEQEEINCWLEFGKETERLGYSIVELDEDEDDVDTVDYFYQNLRALKNYVAVVQECKVVCTKDFSLDKEELGGWDCKNHVYEVSAEDNLEKTFFFVCLDDVRDFCASELRNVYIELGEEVACKKIKIYSVCDEVAITEKIESEDDLETLEDVDYPVFIERK